MNGSQKLGDVTIDQVQHFIFNLGIAIIVLSVMVLALVAIVNWMTK